MDAYRQTSTQHKSGNELRRKKEEDNILRTSTQKVLFVGNPAYFSRECMFAFGRRVILLLVIVVVVFVAVHSSGRLLLQRQVDKINERRCVKLTRRRSSLNELISRFVVTYIDGCNSVWAQTDRWRRDAFHHSCYA